MDPLLPLNSPWLLQQRACSALHTPFFCALSASRQISKKRVVLLVHREIGVGKPDHHPRLLLTSEADRHPRLLLTSEQPFFVQRVV